MAGVVYALTDPRHEDMVRYVGKKHKPETIEKMRKAALRRHARGK